MDTKFLSSSPSCKELINSTVLHHVYESIKDSSIVIEWESPEVSYSLDNPKEHEAGYDAFLTGYCFLGLLKHLNIPLEEDFNPQKSKMLRQYVNRIFVMRIQQNPFIFLTGREREKFTLFRFKIYSNIYSF